MILLDKLAYLWRYICPIEPHHQQLALCGLSFRTTGKMYGTNIPMFYRGHPTPDQASPCPWRPDRWVQLDANLNPHSRRPTGWYVGHATATNRAECQVYRVCSSEAVRRNLRVQRSGIPSVAPRKRILYNTDSVSAKGCVLDE